MPFPDSHKYESVSNSHTLLLPLTVIKHQTSGPRRQETTRIHCCLAKLDFFFLRKSQKSTFPEFIKECLWRKKPAVNPAQQLDGAWPSLSSLKASPWISLLAGKEKGSTVQLRKGWTSEPHPVPQKAKSKQVHWKV